jgi:predicted nuclease with TOPRIM domain
MDLASLSPSSASSPVPLSSEKMRNIYHELGKRQSDIHALSLALAQTTAEKKAILEEQGGLRGTIKAQSEEIRRLQIEKERVMEASIHDADDKGPSLRSLSSFFALLYPLL